MNWGLIADIGGTYARFAVVGDKGIENLEYLKCNDYPTVIEAVNAYLARINFEGKVSKAVFAVAGAVKKDEVEMTNHHWHIKISETKKLLKLEKFELVNDFEIVALAIPHIKSEKMIKIGGGEVTENKIKTIVGGGTGLGLASLVWNGSDYVACAGEGGHVTMAVKNQREFDIINILKNKYRHISAERVCSGKGLVNLYNAICLLDNKGNLPKLNGEEISERAINGTCQVCKESLDMMLVFFGRFAGNAALTLGALGGVYIVGLAAKFGDYFINSAFREEFEAKGRFESYLKQIATYLVTEEEIAFVGLEVKLNSI